MPDACPKCGATVMYRALFYPHTTTHTLVRKTCYKCEHQWTERLAEQAEPGRYDYDPLED